MAEQVQKGKAITVRPDVQQHAAIEKAAKRAGQSMGEWLLSTALQRLHGGPYPRRGGAGQPLLSRVQTLQRDTVQPIKRQGER
jgi:hypothetical protein